MSTANFFTVLKSALKKSGASLNVTSRPLALGSREATTGWRAMSFGGSTIEMPIIYRGSVFQYLVPGGYVRYDAVGFTDIANTLEEFDQIKDADNNYFLINYVIPWKIGNRAYYNECGLTKSTMFQDVPGTLTWSKTRLADPRKQIKTYIDGKARSTQITKDDDSTQATWACIFSEPPYPVAKEFRAASSPVQGLYVVEMPNSTPTLDYDLTPYGYDEHVPIHIVTVDSTGCTGTALNWKMEDELRYVAKTYPTGSHFTMQQTRKDDRWLGSMFLYDRTFMLEYWRLSS